MILTHTCSRCKKDYEANSVPSEFDICENCYIGDSPEFKEFRKIPRFSRDIVITEKIDGTNGVICITDTGLIFAGSRNRWLWNSSQTEVHNDNHGFAQWVKANKEELMQLGVGFHYGEWWGSGIQRGYGLVKGEKRFSLFNTARWVKCEGYDILSLTERCYHPSLQEKQSYCPECCYVVPILYSGIFWEQPIDRALADLKEFGSYAMPKYMKPEGIVIYHSAAKQYFKKTIENDEKGKTE